MLNIELLFKKIEIGDVRFEGDNLRAIRVFFYNTRLKLIFGCIADFCRGHNENKSIAYIYKKKCI